MCWQQFSKMSCCLSCFQFWKKFCSILTGLLKNLEFLFLVPLPKVGMLCVNHCNSLVYSWNIYGLFILSFGALLLLGCISGISQHLQELVEFLIASLSHKQVRVTKVLFQYFALSIVSKHFRSRCNVYVKWQDYVFIQIRWHAFENRMRKGNWNPKSLCCLSVLYVWSNCLCVLARFLFALLHVGLLADIQAGLLDNRQRHFCKD